MYVPLHRHQMSPEKKKGTSFSSNIVNIIQYYFWSNIEHFAIEMATDTNIFFIVLVLVFFSTSSSCLQQ